MISNLKKVLRLSLMLAFLVVVCSQILNVRSPITVQTAMATGVAPTVFGTITSDGEPLSGVIVKLRKSYNSSVVRTATTDSNGNFYMNDISTDRYYYVTGYKYGYTAISSGSFKLTTTNNAAKLTGEMVQYPNGGGSFLYYLFHY